MRTALAATLISVHDPDSEAPSCPVCGAQVVRSGTRGPAPTYCSFRCRRAAPRNLLSRRIYTATRRAERPCKAGCGRTRAKGRPYCSDACMPRASLLERRRRLGAGLTAVSVVCLDCNQPFTRRKWNQVHCSPLCNNRAAKRRRYAAGSRRKFPRIRYRQRRAVLERDRWTCGICHAVIDPALRWPHRGSASIDHVDPFGEHEPANWQASHLACNVAKGARAA